MTTPHVHTPKDGRGLRDVFVNGRLVEQVFYADTKRGIVRAYRSTLRLDKWRKRVLSETLHGVVEVRAKVGAGDTADHTEDALDMVAPNVEVTGVPALSARPVDCRVGRQNVTTE